VSEPAAPATLALEYDIVERDGAQDRLLLLIHGYGESPAPLVDRLSMIDPDADHLVIVPHGPFDKEGHPVWHRGLFKGTPEPREQFATSVRSLDALLDTVQDRTGLPRSEAVIGGFSQGGGISLGLLQSPGVVPPAAVYGICTFVPYAGAQFPRDPVPVAGRPILLTGASEDRFAPVEVAADGARSLAEEGFAVTYFEVPGEHVVTDAAARHVGEWLAALHRGEVPRNVEPPPQTA
jgi:predicted esterase